MLRLSTYNILVLKSGHYYQTEGFRFFNENIQKESHLHIKGGELFATKIGAGVGLHFLRVCNKTFWKTAILLTGKYFLLFVDIYL